MTKCAPLVTVDMWVAALTWERTLQPSPPAFPDVSVDVFTDIRVVLASTEEQVRELAIREWKDRQLPGEDDCVRLIIVESMRVEHLFGRGEVALPTSMIGEGGE